MMALVALTACNSSQPAAATKSSRVIFSQDGRIVIGDGSGKIVVLTTGPGDLMPSPSPDGSLVAFTRVGPSDSAGTYIIKTDGTAEKKVAPIVSSFSQLVWSPDGKQLAIRDTDPTSQGIWTVSADGSNLQRIFEGNGGLPAWTPDGKSIAVAEAQKLPNLNLEVGIYLVDLQSKDKKLIASGSYGAMAWSPDGKNIAAISADKDGYPSDLVLLDYTEGKSTALVGSLAASAWAPSWSPNGKLISAVIKTADNQQLVTISPSGTEAKALAKGTSISSPVWSTDGNSMLATLVSSDTKQSKIIQVSSDGSQPQKELGAGESANNLAGTVAPSKDAQAKPQLEGIRRADLQFSKGSWG